MICLDTNYLIKSLERDSAEASRMVQWYQEGELMMTPVCAWYEFLCGPLTAIQERTTRAFLAQIVPFDEAQAIESARLFNQTGRKRKLRVDAMIAGTAIVAGARLATGNQDDFALFTSHGLKLI